MLAAQSMLLLTVAADRIKPASEASTRGSDKGGLGRLGKLGGPGGPVYFSGQKLTVRDSQEVCSLAVIHAVLKDGDFRRLEASTSIFKDRSATWPRFHTWAAPEEADDVCRGQQEIPRT